ncbi:MAG: hypothetical protein ACTS73_02010 [Arsenophonus sp. NEOnobi-MAG3]
MPSIHNSYFHGELYRLVLTILKLKCLRSGIAVATEYASTVRSYRLI